MAKTRGGYSKKVGKRPQESNMRNTPITSNAAELGRRRPLLGASSSSGVDLGMENFPVPDEPIDRPLMSPIPAASSPTESFSRTTPVVEENDSDIVVPRRTRTGRGLNQGVGIPPPGANKLTIYISDGAILPGSKPPRAIGRICKNYVNGPWIQWSDVDNETRDSMFIDFKKRFNWDMSIEVEVRERFEEKCKGLWADMMNKARKKLMKLYEFTDVSQLMDHPPNWCHTFHWNRMVIKWSSENWRKKSATNFNNRNNEIGGGLVKHVGGSISIPEHKRRITEMEGEAPNPYDLYKRLHQKQKDENGNKIKDGPFIDPKSARVADAYTRKVDEKYADDPSKKPPFDGVVWIDVVGGAKKGRVYGFGDGLQSFALVGVAPGSCNSVGGSRPVTEESLRSQLEGHMRDQREMERKLEERRELELEAVRLQMNREMEEKLEQQRKEMEEQLVQRMMEQQRIMAETIQKMLQDKNFPHGPPSARPGS